MATLAITAYYYPQGGFVEVSLQGIDDSGDVIGPSDLNHVQIKLLKGEITLQSSSELDKFYMDADWRVTVLFSKPASTSGLEVEATMTLRDETVIRKVINVVQGQMKTSEGDFGDNARNILK